MEKGFIRKRKRMETEKLVPIEEEVVVTDSVAEMEKTLNYRFRNKTLIEEVLAESRKSKLSSTSSNSDSTSNYERLEFLGDAALGVAVAGYVFITCPDLEPGRFSGIHKDNINNDKFARVAIQRGFYKYLRPNQQISDFVALVAQEKELEGGGNGVVDGSGGAVKTPKILADFVESIAGAIYVDCGFDTKLLWKYFGDLLEPCVTRTPLYPSEVLKLIKLCEKAEKQVQVKLWREGSQNVAGVYVNGNLLCSSYSEKEHTAKVNAAKEALKLFRLSSFPVDVDVASITGNNVPKIDRVVDKLEELFRKKRWPRPTYKVEKEVGPHGERFTCSVQIETVAGSYLISGGAKRSPKDAKNSSASVLLHGIQDLEDKAIKEKLEKERNQLVETKRETGSEVSAEKVKGDMAIKEKLEKKSNKLVGTKKRKMENGSEVSADKVKVDIAINEKLEKKTKKENGDDVSAEKVEQLFAEENSSIKKITCQSNIQENSKKQALIYTMKHMDIRSVAEVEEILSYRFRNKSLLEEALTHSSYSRKTASLSPNYEGRLEFIGRTVLSLAVSNFLFITYPDLKPYQLTKLREANLNTEKLARVAIRHGFYRYLRCNSPTLDAKIKDFALVVQEEGGGVAYGVTIPPLILVEIVRSIAAAIFVDCEFDFKLLSKYFCGLLEPLVTPDTLQQKPMSILYKHCIKEGKHIDIKYSYDGSQHTVSFNVDGQLVGSGCSTQKNIAKITAAREALKLWNLDSSSMDVDADAGSATVNDVSEIE